MSLDFHSFDKGYGRSDHLASLQAQHFCKAYMLHKRCCVWSGANTGKYHFYSQQVVKGVQLHLYWQVTIAAAFVVVCDAKGQID